ncbi:MAG: hypothetical protein RBT46_06915 [Weeksellaceae bacterium]|jgi:hypothetical protein|nr:hypothetical protein [Weeksellaceae bacterium]MDX9705423.1 hypothetical protein [Weeksellaceae bacterium]
MKRFYINLILFILPLATLFAQVPPEPTEGEDGPGPGAPSATPIDQYIVVLLLFALLMASYVIYTKRKAIVKL